MEVEGFKKMEVECSLQGDRIGMLQINRRERLLGEGSKVFQTNGRDLLHENLQEDESTGLQGDTRDLFYGN